MWSGCVYFFLFTFFNPLKVPVISSLFVTLVVVLCLSLAHWQWQRAQQKQSRLDHIQGMQNKGMLTWQGLSALPTSLNKTGLQLQLTGRLETEQYWLLDNKTLQGRPGFDVLAVFYPHHSLSGLLVNFGWVAQGATREALPSIPLPTPPVVISVQLKEGDLSGFYLPGAQQVTEGWPKLIQYIDINEQQQQSGHPLVPFMAYAVDTKVNGMTEQHFAQPHYQPVVMPPEKHRAYALQWFLLAMAAALVFAFAMRQRYRGAQQEKLKPPPAPERKGR